MKQISTSKADISLLNGNIVKILIHDKAELDVEDMIAINNAKFTLVGNAPYTVLFIPGIFASISTDARSFSATKEAYRNAIAKAILVKNSAHRIIGNFFIKINRPPAPTSLFTSEKQALKWLEKLSVASTSSNS